MSNNIRIEELLWEDPFSIIRAHSGSDNIYLGGDPTYRPNFGDNWAPNLTKLASNPEYEGQEALSYFRGIFHTDPWVYNNPWRYPGLSSGTGRVDAGEANIWPIKLDAEKNHKDYIPYVNFSYNSVVTMQNLGYGFDHDRWYDEYRLNYEYEAYTTPYTGLGTVVCETDTNTTWEWSVTFQNASRHLGVGKGSYLQQDEDYTITIWIFGLDENGNLVYNQTNSSGIKRAMGTGTENYDQAQTKLDSDDFINRTYTLHPPGNPTSIPSNGEAYYLLANVPTTMDVQTITGTATFNGNSKIRYLSMRIDLDESFHKLYIADLKLKPLNIRFIDNALGLDSPRVFRHPTTPGSPIGHRNANVHEYTRITFGSKPASSTDDSIPQRLIDQGLVGFRYGPNFGATGTGASLSNWNAVGGTEVHYPTGWQSNEDGVPVDGNGSKPSKNLYHNWLLWYDGTNSSSTGPTNGIPPLPEDFADIKGTKHCIGYKRDEEPQSLNSQNYLYAEGSHFDGARRFALRLPAINFTATTSGETLSFYYYAYGAEIGALKVYATTQENNLFIENDSVPGGAPGSYKATRMNTLQFPYLPIQFAAAAAISGLTSSSTHGSGGMNWYRCEVDLSELRGTTQYLVLLYELTSVNGYTSDFAISNIMVTGHKPA